MSRFQTILERVQQKPTPSNVTWDDFCYLLSKYGYVKKPSARGFKFRKDGGAKINAHKPHPGNEVPPYLIRQVLDKLKQCGDM